MTEEPLNPLEQAVARFRTGQHASPELVRQLLQARVHVLIGRLPPQPPGADKEIEPMFVTSAEGTRLIALFSARERALACAKGDLSRHSLIEVAVRWFLTKLPAGFGLVLNPGQPFSFELSPESVAQARQHALH